MNPKEKSKDLIESFESALKIKDCALIVVDELILHIRFHLSYGYEKQLEFWHEVKKELEKLEK